MALLDNTLATPLLHSGAGDYLYVPFILVIDGSGNASFNYDYDGLLTVTKNSNQYSLTFGAQYKGGLALYLDQSATTVQTFVQPSNGVAILAFGAAQTNQTYHGLAVLDIDFR